MFIRFFSHLEHLIQHRAWREEETKRVGSNLLGGIAITFDPTGIAAISPLYQIERFEMKTMLDPFFSYLNN